MRRPSSNRSNAGATSSSAVKVGTRPGPRRCLVVLLALLLAQLYLSYTSHHQERYVVGPPVPRASSTAAAASSSSRYFDFLGGDTNRYRQTTSLSPAQNALVALLSEGLGAAAAATATATATATTTETTTKTTRRTDPYEGGSSPAGEEGDDDDDDDDPDLSRGDEGGGDGDDGGDDVVLASFDDGDADDANNDIASSSEILAALTRYSTSTSTTSLPSKLQSFPYNHTFPRWGETDDEGIDFRALLRFVEGLVDRRTTTLPADLKDFPDVFPEVIHVWGALSAPPSSWLERRLRWNRTVQSDEVLMGTDGVYVSEALRKRTTRRQVRHRVVPVEKFLQRSWSFLAHHAADPAAIRRWPRLVRTMSPENSTQAAGGFPVIVWHGDYRGCNRFNFERNVSIPLLTTCAHVRCHHSLPFPTYRTIADALPTPGDWDALFQKEATVSPWNAKIRKLVWRGGLTGPLDNFKSPRSRLGIWAARHASHPLVDVGIHHIPPRHYHPHSNRTVPWNLAKRVHMKPPMPAANFSNYVAILDTDGNSWSSRFGRLLCANSVIVKVEPHYVDYFYRHLRPWVHYVPVRHDLSNLLDVVEWVLDVGNEGQVLRIVSSAQAWCRRHMTYGAIVHDMLDVLDAYVSYLDRGDREWPTLWTEAVGRRLWDPSSGLDMRKLSHRIPVVRTNFTANALKDLRANRTTARPSDGEATEKNSTLRTAIAKAIVSSLNGTKGGKKLGRRNTTPTSGSVTGTKKRPSKYKKKYGATYRKRLT